MKKVCIIAIVIFFSLIAIAVLEGFQEGHSDSGEKSKPVPPGEVLDIPNRTAKIDIQKEILNSMPLSRQSVEPAGNDGTMKQKVESLLSAGNDLNYKGDRKGALNLAKQALDISEKLKDKRLIARSCNSVGRVNTYMGDWSVAMEYYRRAINIWKEIGDTGGEAGSEMEIGLLYLFTSNYQSAMEILAESLQKNKQLGNEVQSGRVSFIMGAAYIDLGDYDKAIRLLMDALEIYEKHGNNMGVARCFTRIGEVHTLLNNHETALDFLKKSLKLKEEYGQQWEVGNAWAKVGTVYSRMGDRTKAIEHLTKGLEIVERVDDKEGISYICIHFGRILLERNDYREALKYLYRAQKVSEETKNKLRYIQSLCYIGRTYTKMRRYDEAEKILDSALPMAEKRGVKERVRDVYEAQAEVYAGLGNYKKAFEFGKKRAALSEVIFNEEMSRKVTGMSIRYNTLKKEKEIELLTKNNEIQNLSLISERLTKQVFIIGFGLVSALFVLLFRNYLYLFSFWKKHKYIGRYRLLEEVGAGGMGTIYKAHNARNKKESAAIKILKPELFPVESNRKRFKQEGEIIDKLHHPHIINIIERGEDKGKLFIAMEYLEGRTLKSKILENGPIVLQESLYIMIQVADALVLVHDKGIIHRDINPSNIMLIEREGDANYVKLLDFGLSMTSYQTRITMTGMVMGTVDYLSPEQVTGGELSTATDVYCLGTSFYEMIAGQTVYPDETIGTLTQKIIENNPTEPKRIRRQIPDELNELIMRMMRKEKESRPAMKEVYQTLQDIRYRYRL